jgi:hypothetical protein
MNWNLDKSFGSGCQSWRHGFRPRSVHVLFVVDKFALARVLLREIGFYPVSTIPPLLHTRIHVSAPVVRTTWRCRGAFEQSKALAAGSDHWTIERKSIRVRESDQLCRLVTIPAEVPLQGGTGRQRLSADWACCQLIGASAAAASQWRHKERDSAERKCDVFVWLLPSATRDPTDVAATINVRKGGRGRGTWHVWGVTRNIHRGWCGNPEETDLLEDQGIDWEIIL